MTIGQLVECVTGKACAMYGGFGDCTAFNNKGSKVGVFGEMLTKRVSIPMEMKLCIMA